MPQSEPPLCSPPDPDPRPARFTPPSGAVDCHSHVFDSNGAWPLTPDRSYTPPPAPWPAYRKMLDVIGIDRAVLVQPSVYGTDNRLMADVLKAHPETLRGVAVLDLNATDSELETLAALGVRGLRANLLYRGGINLKVADHLARRIADLGWHLQLLIDVSTFPDLRKTFDKFGVPLVFDHMGHMAAAKGVAEPGFQDMLALLRDGRAWVKLSGAYRITAQDHPPYDDVTPLARAILKVAPERAVWGTDWPHPAVKIPMPNDGDLLNLLADWAPDPDLRHRILVENPEALYGFTPNR